MLGRWELNRALKVIISEVLKIPETLTISFQGH